MRVYSNKSAGRRFLYRLPDCTGRIVSEFAKTAPIYVSANCKARLYTIVIDIIHRVIHEACSPPLFSLIIKLFKLWFLEFLINKLEEHFLKFLNFFQVLIRSVLWRLAPSVYTHTVLSVSIFVYTHIMLLKVLYRVNQTTLLTVYIHTQTRCAYTAINRPVDGSYIDYPTAQVELCQNSRRLHLYTSRQTARPDYILL